MAEPRDPRLIMPDADSQGTLATFVSVNPYRITPAVLIGYKSRELLTTMTEALSTLAKYKPHEDLHDGRRFRVTLTEKERDLWEIHITNEHDADDVGRFWHGTWLWSAGQSDAIRSFRNGTGCVVALTTGPLVGRDVIKDPQWQMWVPNVIVNARRS